MNWAEERAREIEGIFNCTSSRESLILAIAAALQKVADECADVAKKHRLRNNQCGRAAVTSDEHRAYENRLIGCIEVEGGIRARFPKEEK